MKMKVSTFSHKGKFVCNFCFGRNCRVEDWKRAINPCIKGLHSNFIGEDLIATARLSNRKIQEFDMLNQLKALKCGAVFNLEEPGEHPLCGDGLVSDEIGFSYDPEIINNAGIAYFNCFW
jgi:hypothetical protein